jgi:hypothetical protein
MWAEVGDVALKAAGALLALGFVGWLVEGLWFKRPGR